MKTGFVITLLLTLSIECSSQFVAKSDFELSSLSGNQSDSLYMVAGTYFILYPFGYNEKYAQPVLGKLNRFTVKEVSTRGEDTSYHYYDLQYGRNHLRLVFSAEYEGQVFSYIQSGDIYDSTVVLRNGVHVGMSIVEFLNIFFDRVPTQSLNKYRVIVLDYVVMGAGWHSYSFTNGKLSHIHFDQTDLQ